MKSFHLVALVCFALAFAFYIAPWPQGAAGFVAVGALLELAAWFAIFKGRR